MIGTYFNLILPWVENENYIWVGPVATIIWFIIIAYAIVAHRLFDIRVIIRRTVVYSGLLIFALATYSIVIFVFTQLFGGDGQALTGRALLTNIIAALLIAVGFEPLRKWLTQITDKYLFKGEYDPQTVVRELASQLSSVLDLDEALDAMMRHVVKNLRLAHAATIVVRQHVDLPGEDSTTQPKFDIHRVKQVGYKNANLLSISEKDLFLKYFTGLRQLVVTEELVQSVSAYVGESIEKDIIDTLHRFKVAVSIPMVVKDKVIGIVMFGEKLSGDPFLNQDLELLQTVAVETASAIQKARLYEEDQLKSEFVSIASHELLTPTAAIEGYLSMVLEERLVEIDEKAREYLTRVYTSAKRLSQLVKDLLSVSRIEGGRVVIDRQSFSVVELVDQVVNDLLIISRNKGIFLIWDKKKQSVTNVFADREKVIQVLVNLISNAIKYNRPKGKVTIDIQSSSKMVSINVSDTGVGLAKDEIPHLFEKFYRTKSAADSAIQGSGLGLYISKKLVELMGGSIMVVSALGRGSTFTLTLPAAKSKIKRQITGDPKLMSPDQKAYVQQKQSVR